MYEAPESDAVPGLVQELVHELESDVTTPAIVRAAMAHLNLVLVHLFRDGNGRMSRCIQTLVLAREQILAQELCSIEEYLGRNTDAYYRILAQVGQGAWNPSDDARPWVRYCLEAHYVQAESVLRRIRESGRMWTEIEDLRKEHRMPERVTAALFDAAIGLRVRNSSYRAQLRAGVRRSPTKSPRPTCEQWSMQASSGHTAETGAHTTTTPNPCRRSEHKPEVHAGG